MLALLPKPTLFLSLFLSACEGERLPSMASILAFTNTTRVLEDLLAMREFGAGQKKGLVTRSALSAEDLAARRFVATRMEEAGLIGVQLDGLGTVYGSSGVENIPALLMGSHTDTREEADWLVGTLGIAYALEAARVLHQGGAADVGAWSVVDWQDREGHFGTLTSSTAFVSPTFTSPQALWRARSDAGLAGVKIMHASGRHGGWMGYLEAHTEHGSVLKRMNATLGVVCLN